MVSGRDSGLSDERQEPFLEKCPAHAKTPADGLTVYKALEPLATPGLCLNHTGQQLMHPVTVKAWHLGKSHVLFGGQTGMLRSPELGHQPP